MSHFMALQLLSDCDLSSSITEIIGDGETFQY